MGSRDDDDAMGLIPTAAAIATFVLGASAGFMYGGPVVAFVGAMSGAAVIVVAYFVFRRRSASASLDQLPPTTGAQLEPQQTVGMISAMAQSAGGKSLHSDLLNKIAVISESAAGDPHAAARDARALMKEYPRSAAVHAELARRELAIGREKDAAAAASEALRLALDGGMNPLAARLVGELDPIREHIELSAHHFERLARVLAAQGDQTGSAWAEAQRSTSAEA